MGAYEHHGLIGANERQRQGAAHSTHLSDGHTQPAPHEGQSATGTSTPLTGAAAVTTAGLE